MSRAIKDQPTCLVVATVSGEVKFPQTPVLKCGQCPARSDMTGALPCRYTTTKGST